MENLISVNNLMDAIHDREHPVYKVSDEDIKRMNSIIIDSFARMYRCNNDHSQLPKRALIDMNLCQFGYPEHTTFAAFLYGNGGKAEALNEEINRMLDNAGFYTKAIPNKGLYVYLKTSK